MAKKKSKQPKVVENKAEAIVPTTRNWVAKHQWQRGGAHDTPHKAQRQQSKQKLKKAIRAKQFGSDFFTATVAALKALFTKESIR